MPLFFTQWLFVAGLLVSLLYVLTILTTVIAVILDKRDPTKAMLWVVVLVMLPIAGLLLYFFLVKTSDASISSNEKNEWITPT